MHSDKVHFSHHGTLLPGHFQVQYKNRLTKSGELVITSQRYRSQRQNLDDAVLRLTGILREASEVPKGPSQLTVARIKALLVSPCQSAYL